MMRAPHFWTQTSWQSQLLRPVSWIYGGISGMRMQRPPRYRASVPVIAIGNFTAGGAGKTPTAIAITQMAIGLGFSPIVLMRGYGGRVRDPVLINAAHDSSIDVGDEALMIAGSIVRRRRQRLWHRQWGCHSSRAAKGTAADPDGGGTCADHRFKWRCRQGCGSGRRSGLARRYAGIRSNC